MTRRRQTTRVRLRRRSLRRRRPLSPGPTRRRRGLRLLARAQAARRRTTQRVMVAPALGPPLRVVVRPRRLRHPSSPDPGG